MPILDAPFLASHKCAACVGSLVVLYASLASSILCAAHSCGGNTEGASTAAKINHNELFEDKLDGVVVVVVEEEEELKEEEEEEEEEEE